MFESFLLMLTYLPSSLSRSSILWYAPSLNSVLMLTFMKGDLWSDYHSNKKKSKAKLAARTHTGHSQITAERSSWETVGRQRAVVTRQDGGIAATWCTLCLCVFLWSLFRFCHQSCPQNFVLWFCSVFYCFCLISFSLSLSLEMVGWTLELGVCTECEGRRETAGHTVLWISLHTLHSSYLALFFLLLPCLFLYTACQSFSQCWR